MQLTMNNDQVSVPAKTNRIFSWLSSAAQKVAALFTKKENPAIDKKVTEAIEFIEWRTWYDQQRITRYIYTESFRKNHLGLYQVLEMVLPIKSPVCGDSVVNIQITDNSFERRLVRYFGNLRPATKLLLDGKTTKAQRFARKSRRLMELYIDKVSEMTANKSLNLNGYERQIVNELISQITVHIPTTTQLQFSKATDSVEPEEVAIEVLLEAPVENTKPLTDTEPALPSVIANKKSVNELTIKELKAYAKVRGIRIPGSVTKIRKMKEIVVAAQNGSTRIIK